MRGRYRSATTSRAGVPPRSRDAAAGFALLALLGMLLVGAAGALLLGGGRGAPDVGPSRALDELARLVAAREALLAYAATYPELYGPTGAGPGHLPCPDTDDSFRLAGPNPPCGRRPVATGRLPAHVTVAAARVGLDVRAAGTPIGYRLDARVANNPARRPLASGPPAGGPEPGPAAELSLPARGGGDVVLRVRADELAEAAERRVAAWVESRAVLPARADASIGPAGPAGPFGTDGGAEGGTDEEADEEDVLALVARSVPTSVRGETVELVDGVARARHWFAADGWASAFRATVEPGCRGALRACAWRADATARRIARRAARRIGAASLPRIELRLVPVDAATAPVEGLGP